MCIHILIPFTFYIYHISILNVCFKRDAGRSILSGRSLKLVDKLDYLIY